MTFVIIGLIVLVILAFVLYDFFDYKKYKKKRRLELIKINSSGEKYEYAKINDYGYKDTFYIRRVLKRLLTALVIFVCLSLYFSIFLIFLQSVNSSSLVTTWDHFTLEWYGQLFSNKSLNNALLHTFTVSTIATLISTVLGTLIAIGIYYSAKKLKKHILLLNNIPLLNADIVTGISLMLIFSSLMTIDPYVFGLKTLVLAHLYFCLPYVVLNVLNKLKELDQNIVDASYDLGIKPFKTLIKIIVPALKSGIFAGAIYAFTMSFDDFVISYYTSGNGYDNLSVWIYSSIGRKSLTPVVYCWSILIILVFLLCIVGAIIFNTVKERRKKHVKK